MKDVYERLAKRLDEMPNGFPPTENGVEIKILKKIYSPDDAEMALKLKNMPETSSQVAARLNMPEDGTREILDKMAANGQIASFKLFGQQVYMLFPFAVGIYEFQLNRIDREFAEMLEEYAPTLFKTLGGYRPELGRVIPVNLDMELKTQVNTYEDVTKIIERSKSFKVQECICRKERALLGHTCKHKLETCLVLSEEENAFDYFNLAGTIISKEEAFKLLKQVEEDGLVHTTFYNVKERFNAICNCCPCCCGVIRAVKELNAPHILAKSNFSASIDEEMCDSCGICAQERCPMDAITESDGAYQVSREKCIGCGVCTVACKTGAIKLIRKPDDEHVVPPDNLIVWMQKRAENRGTQAKI